MSEVTRILDQIQRGDPQAAELLLPLVYEELRRLAAVRLAQEKPGQTLQATALVHEAYLRLVGDQQFSGRGHFFAAAAEAMRRILVENARRKKALRHGGDRQRAGIDAVDVESAAVDDDLLALDEALQKLAEKDPDKATLVKLRYFAGFTMEQACEALGISPATGHRHWNYARAWLHQQIADEG